VCFVAVTETEKMLTPNSGLNNFKKLKDTFYQIYSIITYLAVLNNEKVALAFNTAVKTKKFWAKISGLYKIPGNEFSQLLLHFY
jgi:hypothetical protein